jgi:bifunctional DNA-binding transcriptional regulator/antitoxin component of YhaV-PrlF toxin-antitoxin module
LKSVLATVLTERGQISIPTAIRKKANLVPGQPILMV